MMKSFTRWLVRRCIKDHAQVSNPEVRGRYGRLAATISIVLNVLLFIIKGTMGIMLHSVGLIADAVHTLTDSGTSIIIFIGFHLAQKPADKEHPFGHGRAESIAALVVALILIVTGIEILKSSVIKIFDPVIQSDKINAVVVVILTATVVLKELMARLAVTMGDMIESIPKGYENSRQGRA